MCVQDWFRILSDPNRQQLGRMMQVGERVSWPSLHMVRNRMIIEVSSSVRFRGDWCVAHTS